jgi:hypothetical protein
MRIYADWDTTIGSGSYQAAQDVGADGAFTLKVSKGLNAKYRVRLELMQSTVISDMVVPGMFDSVKAGANNVRFAIKKIASKLEGTVRDSSGHVMKGIGIWVNDTANHLSLTTSTDSLGKYLFTLPNGKYTVGYTRPSGTIEISATSPQTVLDNSDVVIDFSSDVAGEPIVRAIRAKAATPHQPGLFVNYRPGQASVAFSVISSGISNGVLSIYSLSGKMVARLHSGMLADGPQMIYWNLKSVRNGVYIARLLINGSKKIEFDRTITIGR